MAIRKNTNPRMMDLQPEMQDILRRNGMQAHVVSDDTGYRLVVQGHDSPLLTYDLTERQMLALTDWGTVRRPAADGNPTGGVASSRGTEAAYPAVPHVRIRRYRYLSLIHI